MKLIDNARAFLRHAWSVRLSTLAGLIAFGNSALPVLAQVDPSPLLALLSGGFAFAAVVAQFVKQKKLSGAKDASEP